jgi:uridine kinase
MTALGSETLALGAGRGPGRRRVKSYRALAETIAARPPEGRLATRVIAVDGYSGAGKSFFARRLAADLGAEFINTDDLMPGWSGLAGSLALLAEWVLEPITAGDTARWHRYDWEQLRYREWVELGPCHALVVDGCAVGHRSLAPYLSLLVWVSAPATLRAKRLAQRFDWEMYEPHAAMWAAQESSLRSGDDVTTLADLIVDNGLPELAGVARFDPEKEFVYWENGRGQARVRTLI